jgi:hypothetical protein
MQLLAKVENAKKMQIMQLAFFCPPLSDVQNGQFGHFSDV